MLEVLRTRKEQILAFAIRMIDSSLIKDVLGRNSYFL